MANLLNRSRTRELKKGRDPACTSTSVATAQAWDVPRLEVRIGPYKLCPVYCYLPGYCCKPEGVL